MSSELTCSGYVDLLHRIAFQHIVGDSRVAVNKYMLLLSGGIFGSGPCYVLQVYTTLAIAQYISVMGIYIRNRWPMGDLIALIGIMLTSVGPMLLETLQLLQTWLAATPFDPVHEVLMLSPHGYPLAEFLLYWIYTEIYWKPFENVSVLMPRTVLKTS